MSLAEKEEFPRPRSGAVIFVYDKPSDGLGRNDSGVFWRRRRSFSCQL